MCQSRNERLAADYREMMKIQNRPYLSWIAVKGEPPYVEEYLLDVNLRSYALAVKSHKYIIGAVNRFIIKVTLWDSYPYIAPNIRMLNIPPVFHPDWYSKGTYSPSQKWSPDILLKDYIKDMLDAMRYEPSLIHTSAPANYKAMDWYKKNIDNTSLFPSDTTELSENSPEEADAAELSTAYFEEIPGAY